MNHYNHVDGVLKIGFHFLEQGYCIVGTSIRKAVAIGMPIFFYLKATTFINYRRESHTGGNFQKKKKKIFNSVNIRVPM